MKTAKIKKRKTIWEKFPDKKIVITQIILQKDDHNFDKNCCSDHFDVPVVKWQIKENRQVQEFDHFVFEEFYA